MKLFFIGLAVIATAYAALPSTEYLPPPSEEVAESPVELQSLAESTALADDGYRYKTLRRIRYRHRRDVNELPSSEYLPPAEAPVELAPEVAPAEPQESAPLADDGYRYRTVKRIRYRHRRDVNELPSSEYLPPAEAPVELAPEVAPAEHQESAPLADDGYRYRTVKRIRYRHRRDVNELPSSEYLPPAEAPVELAPEVAPAEHQESAPLADDGYRYRTVKRIRYRHRRDVNELPSSEYLPPAEAPVELAPEVAPAEHQESAPLADDGYRYRTVKRIRYRHRRDVNELPSSEYLPPAEAPVELAPEVAPAEHQESAPLADDGYRYRTVKRIRYRHRRDVNELPSSEYLPPAEAPVELAPEVAPAEHQESAPLADDGYRYRTVKRIRYRHRRDVNELPSSEYLPPAEAPVELAPEVAPAEPQESAPLADDGYRYRTVKRIRYRHRRDVNELPSSEYLPPAEAPVELAPEVAPAEPQESAPLADDGYRYRTVKRIRYRHRRDVNELPSSEYLPPAEAPVELAPEVAPAEPQESAPLADDGYRYRTVKRIRYRHRRDVNELPSSEYLPPAEAPVELAPEVAPAEPQESAPLADDGYRYRTVKRIRYRHRRDVNELPSSEYLPPADAPVELAPEVAPAEHQESAPLADDGYRYRTVKRIRYRHRRDVNELPSSEYLPPAEAPVELAPEVAPAEPQESAPLADDGYRYRTVKRIRYRHRRDVNELPSSEYLPPAEAPVELAPEVAPAEPQESAPLADDGYRYKTVKRFRYRYRH